LPEWVARSLADIAQGPDNDREPEHRQINEQNGAYDLENPEDRRQNSGNVDVGKLRQGSVSRGN
jgi:hypothetical protein